MRFGILDGLTRLRLWQLCRSLGMRVYKHFAEDIVDVTENRFSGASNHFRTMRSLAARCKIV